jgi:hypothetical protein
LTALAAAISGTCARILAKASSDGPAAAGAAGPAFADVTGTVPRAATPSAAASTTILAFLPAFWCLISNQPFSVDPFDLPACIARQVKHGAEELNQEEHPAEEPAESRHHPETHVTLITISTAQRGAS